MKYSPLIPGAVFVGGLFIALAKDTKPKARAWDRQTLTKDFLTEGLSAGDIDGDGKPDLVAGPLWFPGPDFKEARRYRPGDIWQTLGYAGDSFLSWVHDLDGDGDNDIVMAGTPGKEVTWYENPGKESEAWAAHRVMEEAACECPDLVDLTGDGRMELVCMQGGKFGYATPDPEQPDRPWAFTAISGKRYDTPYVHGLGIGDLNGDGRADVLERAGWLEQPEKAEGEWTFHEVPFAPGRGGSQMLVHDWDGDGDADVVTSQDGHGYGLAWFENEGAKVGAPSFKRHDILSEDPAAEGLQFSQLHALAMADLDGDGRRDFVTGKRYWAHNGNDPGADGPAVLVAFFNRNDGDGIRWQAVTLDEDSGVGCQVVATDLDGDGVAEVATGSKKGVHVVR